MLSLNSVLSHSAVETELKARLAATEKPISSSVSSSGSAKHGGRLSSTDTPYSSPVSSTASEDWNIDNVLSSIDKWTVSDTDSLATSDVQNSRWQEFPPPEELSLFLDGCSEEISVILRQSLLSGGEYANERSSVHSRKISQDLPMLAAELHPSSQPKLVAPHPDYNSCQSSAEKSQPDMRQTTFGDFTHRSDRPSDMMSPHQAPQAYNQLVSYSWSSPDSFNSAAMPETPISENPHSRTTSISGSLRSKFSVSRSTLTLSKSKPTDDPVPPLPKSAVLKQTPSKVKKKDFKNAVAQCQTCSVNLQNRYLIILTCDHKHCKRCFPEFIMKNFVDRYIFPPVCCDEQISAKLVQAHLESAQKTTFKEKEKAALANPSLRLPKQPTPRETFEDFQRPARSILQNGLSATPGQSQQCDVCGSHSCSCEPVRHYEVEESPILPQNVFSISAFPQPPRNTVNTSRAADQTTSRKAWEVERDVQRRNSPLLKDIKSKFTTLGLELAGIHEQQMTAMDERHEEDARLMREAHASERTNHSRQMSEASDSLDIDSNPQIQSLKASHAQILSEMTERHREEEDDTFLSATRAYRGKPDRDARIANMLEKIVRTQTEESAEIERNQKDEMEKLTTAIQVEAAESKRSLSSASRIRKSQANKQIMMQTKRFWADGEWFSAIVDVRAEMLQAEQRRQVDEVLSRR